MSKPAKPKRSGPGGHAPEPPPRDIVVTNVRIYRDQLLRLQRMALEEHHASGAGGRVDASAVLRRLLDQHLPPLD